MDGFGSDLPFSAPAYALLLSRSALGAFNNASQTLPDIEVNLRPQSIHPPSTAIYAHPRVP